MKKLTTTAFDIISYCNNYLDYYDSGKRRVEMDRHAKTSKQKILLIDDEYYNLKAFIFYLKTRGFKILTAEDGETGFEQAKFELPDLILLDIMMPEIDGFEVCSLLKKHEKTRKIPVIFMTSLTEINYISKAFSAGGVDYVIKPFQPEEVMARINTHLTIKNLQRELENKNLNLEKEIIERKRSEQALRESQNKLIEQNEQLRKLTIAVTQSPGSIVITDPDGNIEYVNPGFERITGYSFNEVFGQNPRVLKSGTHSEAYYKSLWETISSGNVWYGEFLNKRKDGSLYWEMSSIGPVINEEGKITHYVAVKEDITRRKEVEAELLNLTSPNPVPASLTKMTSFLDSKEVFKNIIGNSKPMIEVYQQIHEVAAVDSIVLINGETGTGKELAARAIHALSNRNKGPFIAVNCASFSESLILSQLFGHAKGAFTGALKDHIGFFEAANGGTLFLDEIGDIPLNIQAQMLRTIQENEVLRLGDSKPLKIDVRLIAATHQDLKQEVNKGNFRSDLYYRLCVATITLPPLRKRREDIVLLIDHFLKKFRTTMGKHVQEVDKEFLRLLISYDWPGNVRELQNVIESAIIKCKVNLLLPSHLPSEIASQSKTPVNDSIKNDINQTNNTFDEKIKEKLINALKKTGGNRAAAARILGIGRSTLYRHLKKLGLDK
jgi:formate hydrogenlyase transcriptional activator